MRINELLDCNEVYIFCVNFTGLVLADYLITRNSITIAFLDNDKSLYNKRIYGFECMSPEKANPSVPCVIVANKSGDTIEEQLKKLGFVTITRIDDEWKEQYVYGHAPLLDDEKYLKIDWFIRYRKMLDLNRPQTFNEKIQWLKIHDRQPRYRKLVDKYEVKSIVADLIGKEYVVPTLGVYDCFDEIPVSELPDKFVMKCTHDSGGIEICKDKSSFDFSKAKDHLENCMKTDYFYYEREWPYKGIQPRIIVEQFLEDQDKNDILDYKFFCFDGVPRLIEVDHDRYHDHKRNLYSPEWDFMDFSICYKNDTRLVIDKPKNLQEMLDISIKLSVGIPHVRVDLYNVNGKIYFGEMTFSHGGGYEKFSDEEWNYKLGSYISVI